MWTFDWHYFSSITFISIQFHFLFLWNIFQKVSSSWRDVINKSILNTSFDVINQELWGCSLEGSVNTPNHSAACISHLIFLYVILPSFPPKSTRGIILTTENLYNHVDLGGSFREQFLYERHSASQIQPDQAFRDTGCLTWLSVQSPAQGYSCL